jgi:uncharacterized protein with PIN domain
MKFLCDQMLGTLAKWLRIYGFDTFYASNIISDDKLIEISKDETRVLISRDKELIQIAKRENIKTIELKTTDIDEQIKAVLSGIKLDDSLILSRCILCNAEVEKLRKEEVKEKIPKRVFENNEDFWFCKNCNKIYWKGSHYEKMIEKIKQLS